MAGARLTQRRPMPSRFRRRARVASLAGKRAFAAEDFDCARAFKLHCGGTLVVSNPWTSDGVPTTTGRPGHQADAGIVPTHTPRYLVVRRPPRFHLLR